LICDNASVHEQIPLQNIELVYLMASLQMRFDVKWKYRQEVDIMDEMIENPDYEEDILLQNAMEEMILEDEEQNQNDYDVELVPELLVEEIELISEEPERNLTKKQSQITDFFRNENKFQVHINL